jgi:hypothetical protein
MSLNKKFNNLIMKIIVFRNIKCNTENESRISGEFAASVFKSLSPLFDSENESSEFFRHYGTFLPVYKTSLLKKQ